MAEPVEDPTNSSYDTHIRATGDVNIGGDIVGRDKITLNVTNVYQRYQVEPQPKFLIPYARAFSFVGRDDELRALHAQLHEGDAVGHRPVILTGLGGVGKTQLAVEYAYRYRNDYPGGIYWVNASQDWQDELAACAEDVGFRRNDTPEGDRYRLLARAFAEFLDAHSKALLIFDNVEDPRLLLTPKPGFVPSELSCRLLVTSRRLAPDLQFASIEVRALSESAALELLLSKRTRTATLSPAEAAAARSICRSLGCLPLAVALSAAYLGKYSAITLSAFRNRLETEGKLATIDASGTDPLDLPTRHDVAVTATLKSQWDTLHDENAKLVLSVICLSSEFNPVPRARLALLTGLNEVIREGYPAPLDDALITLKYLSLIEELNAFEIGVHPLVDVFVKNTILDATALAEDCTARLSTALSNIARLHNEVQMRGVDSVLADLRSAHAISVSFSTKSAPHLTDLLRLLDLEAYHLRNWNPQHQPNFFLQQLRNRCLDEGHSNLQAQAEAQLTDRGYAYLRKQFRSKRESPELVRKFRVQQAFKVLTVTVTPDGRHIISAEADRLRIWDLNSGKLVRELSSPLIVGRHGVAVSPNGHFIITSRADFSKLNLENVLKGFARTYYDLVIIDFENEKILRTLRGHVGTVHGIAVTSNAEFIISASEDGTAIVWDFATGQAVHILEHNGSIFNVAVTPDSRFAISACIDSSLTIWELNTGQIVNVLKGHWASVLDVAITPDGYFAVSASIDGTLRLWDLKTGAGVWAVVGDPNGVYAVAITSDGKYVISTSHDCSLKVWDLTTGQLVGSLIGHSREVKAIVTTPHGRFVISGSDDYTIRLWDLTSVHPAPRFRGHTSAVRSITITPDGRFAISASDDKTLKVWDMSSGRAVRTLKGHNGWVWCVAITQDGRFAISGSRDGTLKVWDMSSRRAVRTLKGHNGWIRDVATTPDGQFAISASIDFTLKVWDLADGKEVRTLKGHTNWVNGVAITPNGRFVVSASGGLFASSDWTVRLWDFATGEVIQSIEGFHPIRVAATYDNRLALCTSENHGIILWDIAARQIDQPLLGHTGEVLDVKAMTDPQFAVSVSRDHTLKIWDLIRKQSVLNFAADAPLWCCAATPDCRTIVAGDEAGGVHFLEWMKPAT